MLRHRDGVRYERARARTISVPTKAGVESTVAVGVSDALDPAAWGLDEAGVLAKHERLADPALRTAAADLIAGRPDHLHAVIGQLAG